MNRADSRKDSPTANPVNPKPVSAKVFATVSEAAEFLNVCRATVYNLMDRQIIPFIPIGGIRRIPWAALHGMLEQAMSNPRQHQR